MIEIYNEYPKRYVVTNKGKILLVTYDHRIAEDLESQLVKYDFPKSYVLSVDDTKYQNDLIYKRM
jgi:hypothetical protein